MTPGARQLRLPRRVRINADAHGEPLSIGADRIEHVRESWLVEDRWWTERPLRRRYWEVVGESGRNAVVFHDLLSGEWFVQ
jgi:hypothetical protein